MSGVLAHKTKNLTERKRTNKHYHINKILKTIKEQKKKLIKIPAAVELVS